MARREQTQLGGGEERPPGRQLRIAATSAASCAPGPGARRGRGSAQDRAGLGQQRLGGVRVAQRHVRAHELEARQRLEPRRPSPTGAQAAASSARASSQWPPRRSARADTARSKTAAGPS